MKLDTKPEKIDGINDIAFELSSEKLGVLIHELSNAKKLMDNIDKLIDSNDDDWTRKDEAFDYNKKIDR